MRETCIAFAKIMIARRANFLKFAPRVLETLYECIRVKIEIVSVTAQQCAKVMVKFLPDSKSYVMWYCYLYIYIYTFKLVWLFINI